MATRFMHYVLAYKAWENMGISAQEQDHFIIGSLLPDIVIFQQKPQTHFNKNRWGMGYDNHQLEEALQELPIMMKHGWRVHLELDRLWQAVCFRPRLYRVPGLLLTCGTQIGQKYYQELSQFDVMFRENLTDQEQGRYSSKLLTLNNYQLPDHPWIDCNRWTLLIEKLQEDFNKKSNYLGPAFVGKKKFIDFTEIGLSFIKSYLSDFNL